VKICVHESREALQLCAESGGGRGACVCVHARFHETEARLQIGNLLAIQDLVHFRFVRPRSQFDDSLQFIARRKLDKYFHQESIELGFGEGVRAFHLDGILSRHDQERGLQRIRVRTARYGSFLHRLEQRRLRLGRRSVQFVGQEEARENRAGLELERAAPRRLLDEEVATRAREEAGEVVRRAMREVERLGDADPALVFDTTYAAPPGELLRQRQSALGGTPEADR